MIGEKINGHNCYLVETDDDLTKLISKIKTMPKDSVFGLDTETTGLDYINDRIVGYCISFGTPNCQYGFYLPIRHINYKNLPELRVVKLIQAIIVTFHTVLHNRDFDFFMMENDGITIPFDHKSNDSQIVCWEATQEKYISLKNYYTKYCKKPVREYTDNFTDKEIKSFSFAQTDPRQSYKYAALDPCITVELFYKMKSLFPFVDVIYPLDNKVAEVLRNISKRDLWVDYKFVRSELQHTEKRLRNLAHEIYRIAGYQFKITSNQQKAEALSQFITLTAKTKTGKYQVNEEVLATIDHPLARLFIEYAETTKYISSYLNPILAREGKPFRISYSSVNVPTGRLSAGGSGNNSYFVKLNIHAIPKVVEFLYVHADENLGYKLTNEEEGALGRCEVKGGLRKAFIAPEGYAYSSPDYSGEELRISANLSGERTWIEAFIGGHDVHAETAAKMFGVSGKANRTKCKILNFSLIYGATVYSLMSRLQTTKDEAQHAYDMFFLKLSNLKSWISRQQRMARKTFRVSTYYGRVRDMSSMYNTSDASKHAFGDRTAINSPIQGCIPSRVHFEFDNCIANAKEIKPNDRFYIYGKEAVITNRDTNHTFYLLGSTGDFMICDSNHKLFTREKDKMVSHPMDDLDGRDILLAPLRDKQMPNLKVIWQYFRKHTLYLLLSVVSLRNRVERSRFFSTLFFIAYIKRDKIKTNNKHAICSLRSLASIHGYNLIQTKKDTYKLKATRWTKTRIVQMMKVDTEPVASVTLRNAPPVYPAMGFLNKNTGGDIMRMKLIQLQQLARTDKEFGDNVIMLQNCHDEISFAIKYEYLPKAFTVIPKTMAVTNKNWEVPIIVEMGLGTSWGTMIDPNYIDEKGRIVDSKGIEWFEGNSPKERGVDLSKCRRVNVMKIDEIDYLK